MAADRHLIPLLALVALLSPALTRGVPAQEALAVLSSDLEPYQEALAGMREAFDGHVGQAELSDDMKIDRETRVVVALGGRAAARVYPDRVTVIACLAPGGPSAPDNSRRHFVRVSMMPAPEAVILRLLQVQPELRRLAIPWMSSSMAYDVDQLSRAVSDAGFESVTRRVSAAEDMPALLRDLRDLQVEAVWLPPDPLLINRQNVLMLREFCWANDIPFYVPTRALVTQGAVGAITSSFRAMGRAAGRSAQAVLDGTLTQHLVYPQDVEFILNVSAAARSGLEISTTEAAHATEVLP